MAFDMAEIDMAEIMRPYNWQLVAMCVLCILLGVVIGLLISGGRKTKAERGKRNTERPVDSGAELPTIGSVRHGETVVIEGAEWTIM